MQGAVGFDDARVGELACAFFEGEDVLPVQTVAGERVREGCARSELLAALLAGRVIDHREKSGVRACQCYAVDARVVVGDIR